MANDSLQKKRSQTSEVTNGIFSLCAISLGAYLEKEHSVFMLLCEKGTGLHHLNDYIVLCVFLHNIRSPSTGTDYVSSFSSAAGASGRKCTSTLRCALADSFIFR